MVSGAFRAVAARCTARHPLPHRDHRLPQHLHAWPHAEPRRVRRRHAAGAALGGALGDRDGDIAVEVGGGEAESFRRRVVEVGDGGGHDIAAPGILDGHGVGPAHPCPPAREIR